MTNTADAAGRQIAPLVQIRNQVDAMGDQFALALPQHIPVERFKRIVLTAINQNPDLLNADRKSLMGACMKASQDGLYPDGREGALVIFNTKGGRAVQWMPMVYGIIKKMRNSGELASIVAHAAYEKDHFEYALGDEERIDHRPILDAERGKMVAVYAIAKLKDGTVQREVMPRAEVEKVRMASRAKEAGPWKDWYEEMARKTVIRRLAKYLPMSTEVEQVLRRDDALYASQESTAGHHVGLRQPSTAAGQLADFATPAAVLEHESASSAQPEAATQQEDGPQEDDAPAETEPDAAADQPDETGEWDDEIQTLIDGGNAAGTPTAFANYKADMARRIDALPLIVRTRWDQFAVERAAELKLSIKAK